jgi:extracellular factor (EF) 3-hydroxypalmitic acid methyl ester biosynthesis protein
MLNEHFYDQTLAMIERGEASAALPLMVGKLYADQADPIRWEKVRMELRNHPLHTVLIEDPYVARAFHKPRGYAGDAELIDFIYDQKSSAAIGKRALSMFEVSIAFQGCEGVRQRKAYATEILGQAHLEGKRICALACGHLREADALVGKGITNIVAVDQDPLSLARVRQLHGDNVILVEANVISYLRSAATQGVQFDLIYTLGLTDYFNARTMSLFHRLMKACLAPGGTILIANFAPHHLAIGWMDAVMDWHLIYRDEAELKAHAYEIGMAARTWRDASGSIIFCEMKE